MDDVMQRHAATLHALATNCQGLADFLSSIAEELSADSQLKAIVLLRDCQARLQEAR